MTRLILALMCVVLMAETKCGAQPQTLEDRKSDDAIWTILRPALLKFQEKGDRAQFLATCRALQTQSPGSGYDNFLLSLIAPMEREARTPLPAFLTRPANERNPKETIQTWIWELREVDGRQHFDPGAPEVFSFGGAKTRPTDELVEIGTPALPFLVAALEDDTPTRSIGWGRSYSSIYYVLRRQDLAMQCLERITGCDFFDDNSSATYLHNVSPTIRNSVLENVRLWWAQSQGKSQAEMIRNQLRLRDKNLSLQSYDKIAALTALAMLEGPQNVLGPLREMAATDNYGLDSPLVEALEQIEPRIPVQAAFERFWNAQSKRGDYIQLFSWGNQKVFQEIARRFEETGHLEEGWSLGDQVSYAARYGKNWAIPLLAKILEKTENSDLHASTGSAGMEAAQLFSDAGSAIELFQKLTSRDFGYRSENDPAARSAAIVKAREWWKNGGRVALQATIDAPRPPTQAPGDLFASDAEIAARVAILNGPNPKKRRLLVRQIGLTYSSQIQSALLSLLKREDQTDERQQILKVLAFRPALWHLPALAEVLKNDSAQANRVAAGHIIRAVVANKTRPIWWIRLETRDTALEAARTLARDPRSPAVQSVAIEILKAWGAHGDRPLWVTPATLQEEFPF